MFEESLFLRLKLQMKRENVALIAVRVCLHFHFAKQEKLLWGSIKCDTDKEGKNQQNDL